MRLQLTGARCDILATKGIFLETRNEQTAGRNMMMFKTYVSRQPNGSVRYKWTNEEKKHISDAMNDTCGRVVAINKAFKR